MTSMQGSLFGDEEWPAGRREVDVDLFAYARGDADADTDGCADMFGHPDWRRPHDTLTDLYQAVCRGGWGHLLLVANAQLVAARLAPFYEAGVNERVVILATRVFAGLQGQAVRYGRLSEEDALDVCSGNRVYTGREPRRLIKAAGLVVYPLLVEAAKAVARRVTEEEISHLGQVKHLARVFVDSFAEFDEMDYRRNGDTLRNRRREACKQAAEAENDPSQDEWGGLDNLRCPYD